MDGVSVLLANIGLGCRGSNGTNTLAYMQCDQIGRNFDIWPTFYLTNFHIHKKFQHMVFGRYFKVSKVVLYRCFVLSN